MCIIARLIAISTIDLSRSLSIPSCEAAAQQRVLLNGDNLEVSVFQCVRQSKMLLHFSFRTNLAHCNFRDCFLIQHGRERTLPAARTGRHIYWDGRARNGARRGSPTFATLPVGPRPWLG
jgi:hypothetical protein